MAPRKTRGPSRIIGRYALFGEIASGGMATVHLGRLLGAVGFSRTVAIKRLHPAYARDPEFVAMALDEARLASRIQHPNVVSVLDVVTLQGELFLILDYIQGDSLHGLLRETQKHGLPAVPPRIALSIVAGALYGLHAAHEAKTEQGLPLNIVHRDVSPQNILVGVDGIARMVDFGIAKAANRQQVTRENQLKGKLSYMAPEQVNRGVVDRRTDIYAAAVVLWEALTGQRLFSSDQPALTILQILSSSVPPPSSLNSDLQALDAVVLRGLAQDPAQRFETARAMAIALEEALPPATAAQVGAWVEQTLGDRLAERASRVSEIESFTDLEITIPREYPLRALVQQPLAPPPAAPEPPAPKVDSVAAVEQVPAREASVESSSGAQTSSRSALSPFLLSAILIVLVALLSVVLVRFRTPPRTPSQAAIQESSFPNPSESAIASASPEPAAAASIEPPQTASPSASTTTAAVPVADKTPRPPARSAPSASSKPPKPSDFNSLVWK